MVNIKKPVFIKMPIDKNDAVVLSLLETISQFTYVKGVIFGNLQKNRQDPSLVQEEVKKWKVGNFSGKPTWERSNELIALCYRNYKNRFIIIGCGGVFSAEDAYKKIKLGASLVQLITGLIYEGPQLVSEINAGMPYLLKRDGFSHISDAIGVESSIR
jgi:dihydroorotate dehydrogenase